MSPRVHKTEVLLPILTAVFDCLAVLASYWLSYYIRFYTPFTNYFEVTLGIPSVSGYFYFAAVTLPIWLLVFQSKKMYRINRSVFVFDEFFVIVKCVSISIIFTMSLIFFYRDFPYSRLVFVIIWITSIILITLGRYLMLKLEKTLYNKNYGVKNVAVVGTNDMAVKIYDKFSKDKFAGFNVIGYFNLDSLEPELKNKKYLGDLSSIPAMIKQHQIEKLLISLPSSKHDELYELMKICEGINVEFMLAPDFIELITSKLKVEEIDGIPFMKLKSLPMNIWNRVLKRTFDIAFSSLILIIISPVFLILAVLVKITSKGPLFYKQERVGLDGRKFNMLKFRSMRIDAEKEGPKMASSDDDRYTPIGRGLRRFSLDELPQFLNVLVGDMSIVGPRPEREYFINIMKDSVKKYLERHRVKCGVTGWAQVNGLRGSNTSMQTRIDYDIYYIENWSLAFDIKIIVKTLKEMFFSKEAF